MTTEEAVEVLRNKTALCVQGGGVLGICHIGALERLQELTGTQQQWTHVVGSSVGSIIAAALACGATVDYLKKKMFGTNYASFKDNQCALTGLVRFMRQGGWYSGDAITEYAHVFLEELTGNGDITFAEAYTMYEVNLTITYMSLRYQTTMYASWQTQPNMKIKDAIRASSSIALFFKYFQGVVESPTGELEQEIATDGGTADNLPIHVLHKQGCPVRTIMALKLVSPEDNSAYEAALRGELHDYGLPGMPVTAAFVVVEALRKTVMRLHVEEEDWKLCVRCNVGSVSSTDFDLTAQQVETLFQAGRKGMSKYLVKVRDMLANGTYPE